MSGHALAQVVFQDVSLLPQDVFVNTFHFRTSGPGVTVGDANAIVTELEAFYNVAHGGGTNPLAFEMSTNLQRNASHIKVFDMSQPEPRVPVVDTTWTLGAGASVANFPNEVACCLSFKATATPGVPLARQRGRIFHGPLNSNTGSSVDQGDNRPGAGYRTELAQAGLYLINSSLVQWCVFSPKETSIVGPDQLYDATSAYVDNSFDTQRRRGRAPTTRTSVP